MRRTTRIRCKCLGFHEGEVGRESAGRRGLSVLVGRSSRALAGSAGCRILDFVGDQDACDLGFLGR